MKKQTATKFRFHGNRAIALLGVAMLILVLFTGCMGQSATPVEEITTTNLSNEVKLGFFDYIKLPFSYLLRWLYDLTGNYGVALIVFAIIVKIIIFPTAMKSKKSMMKMSRLTPKVKALEAKYADDKRKYQEEVQKLYREEKAGGCGGCLWSLLPMLLLIPLYGIIREPITWLMYHGQASAQDIANLQREFFNAAKSPEASAALKSLLTYDSAGQILSSSPILGVYWQVVAMPHIGTLLKTLQAVGGTEIVTMNTRLIGVEMATIPNLMFWQYFDVNGVWNSIGQFLLPLFSGGINLVTMLLSQKMNNSVITNKDGEYDAEMAKKNTQGGKAMTYMMPLFSVYIGFVAPAGLSLYWITQGVLSLVQDYFLTKHYKQIYDEEDRIKQEKAAKEAAEEAERERIRAEKRAQNPEGITANTSKKRLEQKQRQEQAAKEAMYQAKLREAEGQKPKDGDDTRPFRRGRAYRADRFEETKDTNNEE